ncbi:hypothetical protein [Parvibaculum sp.]|jgi:hypothetical protein|uniref:hypothetical protein n=1 Tax=Parvibaculum sp. TaxID=2024848 RepID=UPI001B1123CA|nr:hypothetical protein [Parvibaculum sp.]MBO6678805.1 hypothetical protein [Parvibaculum sp.]MBO6684843.1 hypothetical protein [Parvibaculum sp.]
MTKFDRYKAAGDTRPTEWQMPDTLSQSPETHRHVEPIFDASGSLKRHVLSKLEAEQTEKPEAAVRDDETGRR